MSDMNGELLDYFLAMGSMTPEQERVAKMQKQAEMLRGQSMQPLGMQSAGRVAVAPHPMQVLGQLGMAYGAKRQGDKADAASRGMQGERTKMIKDMIERRRGGAAGVGGYQDEPYGWEG